eukprot:179549-Chlamydomonas_euryale.AAC.3
MPVSLLISPPPAPTANASSLMPLPGARSQRVLTHAPPWRLLPTHHNKQGGTLPPARRDKLHAHHSPLSVLSRPLSTCACSSAAAAAAAHHLPTLNERGVTNCTPGRHSAPMSDPKLRASSPPWPRGLASLMSAT